MKSVEAYVPATRAEIMSTFRRLHDEPAQMLTCAGGCHHRLVPFGISGRNKEIEEFRILTGRCGEETTDPAVPRPGVA